MNDSGSEPLLWRLGVRIESSRDVQLLNWLVGHLGVDEVRGAAYRRRHRLQPRPNTVAEELGVQPPDELEPEVAQRLEGVSVHKRRVS